MHEATPLAITTMGSVTVVCRGEPCDDLATRKTLALLVYLACSRAPVPRETLAGLFWDDVPEVNARASLSVALSHLRKRLPEYIVATRETVAFDRTRPFWLDADVFVRRWHLWRDAHGSGEGERTGKAALDALEEVLALYQGPFLEELVISAGTEFEAWLRYKRDGLQRIAMRALDVLATVCLRRGAYRRGIEHARRLVQLDPFRERSHELVMLLLARDGQRAAALAHYDACRAMLRDELDVAPGVDLQALCERISAGRVDRAFPARPAFTAGRESDLRRIRRRLVRPDCRLLAITGSAGVGKTHVVIEAAWRLQDEFLNGVVYVAAGTRQTPEALAVAIAGALGLEQKNGDNLRERLSYFLHHKELLLVLDGLEADMPAGSVLSALLAAAPDLKILVACRERLDVAESWLHVLRGLSYPEAVPGPDASLADLAATHGAIDFLLWEARRLGVEIAEDAQEREAAVQITQLVDGLPLGIQMAAAWLPVLTCHEIVQNLKGHLSFLVAHRSTQREREQKLVALVAHALEHLSVEEVETYLRLSVFAGSFDRRAAEAIAGADLPLLLTLVEKSLLSRVKDAPSRSNEHPRFVMPPLLQQLAQSRLRALPEGEAPTLDRHATYFCRFVEAHRKGLRGVDQLRALRALDGEQTHICRAWERASSQPQQPWLAQAVDGLGEYFWQRGRYRDAELMFTEAAERVGGIAATVVLRGRLLIWKAVFAIARGETDRAQTCLHESLALLDASAGDTCLVRAFACLHLGSLEAKRDLAAATVQCQCAIDLFRRCGDERDLGIALGKMAEIQTRQGNAEMAETHFAVALHYLEGAGDVGATAALLSKWATVSAEDGDLDGAIRRSRKAHALYQHLQDRGSQASVLQQLGRLLIWQGKWNEAILLLAQSLALYKELGDRRRVPQAETNLALALVNQGEYTAASRNLESALSLAVQIQDHACTAEVYWLQGWISLARGSYGDAKQYLQESVTRYRDVQEQVGLSHALAAGAYAELRSGDDEAARAWLRAALQVVAEVRYPYSALVAVNTAALDLAKRGEPERAIALSAMTSRYAALAHSRLGHDCFTEPFAALTSNLEPAALQRARTRGAGLALWSTVDQLLAEFGVPDVTEEEIPTAVAAV